MEGLYHQLVMFQSKYVINIKKCQKILKIATFSFADAFAQAFSQLNRSISRLIRSALASWQYQIW